MLSLQRFLCLGFMVLMSPLQAERAILVWPNSALTYNAMTLNHSSYLYSLNFLYPAKQMEILQLRQRTLQGDSQAQAKMGDRYLDGDGVEPRLLSAIMWYQLAAKNGSAYAAYQLYWMYLHGIGVAHHLPLASQWLAFAKKHTNQGVALFGFAQRLLHRDSVLYAPKHGVAWLQKAAKQNLVAAQLELAQQYEWGWHVPKNQLQALHWYGRAAGLNNTAGMFNLARMYLKGYGVEQNTQQAFQWMHKAAQRGYKPAKTILGAMYYHGHGISKNHVLAYAWLSSGGVGIAPVYPYDAEHINIMRLAKMMNSRDYSAAVALAKRFKSL